MKRSSALFASNVNYYPNGAIAAFVHGDGIVHSLSRNARGLPLRSRRRPPTFE